MPPITDPPDPDDPTDKRRPRRSTDRPAGRTGAGPTRGIGSEETGDEADRWTPSAGPRRAMRRGRWRDVDGGDGDEGQGGGANGELDDGNGDRKGEVSGAGAEDGAEAVAEGGAVPPGAPPSTPPSGDPAPDVKLTSDPAPSPRTDRMVTVRATAAEVEALDAACAALGLTRNRALRVAMRRVGGFVEVDAETRDTLRDAVRQIGGVATNVNQIAKVANRTGDPDLARFMRERAELGRQLVRLEAGLQTLLDTARRRSDGRARLAEADVAEGIADGRRKAGGAKTEKGTGS